MSEIVNQSLRKIAKAFVGKWVKSIKMRNQIYHALPITHYASLITDYVYPSPITHHPSPITHYALPITDHASPITDHPLRITDYASRITQKNELEYFDMNAMPSVIPMCPNTNMIHTLSLRDKN